MTPIATAAVYIGVNILILFWLSFRVVGRRRSAQVSLGTGGDAQLEQRVRAHGNASEYIPVTMLGLFVVASLAAPLWAIHAIGGVFTLGRVLHGFGLSGNIMASRAFGMVLTWLGMLGAAVALFWFALT
ncbi:MAPEG family protein [Hyphomonas sp. WL0036]|uniref:MAPEG family protein n=1 Tax=Hyphomonas sediminis TaxID=2866160 RepID=UPI001C819DA0|nr:MAPEG family protein [Hyphomonas sediminis]MBY9067348.1 MAPEG family protein [Hyphomonas sediminis]